MVASGYENACSETSTALIAGIHIISTQKTNRKASSPSQSVLVVVSLIRKQLENRGFSQLWMDALWMHYGDHVRVSSMNAIYPNGNYPVANGKSIPFLHL
jgi:hypothetical protein